MEDNERDLGVSVYEKANALLENIEKAKAEMWKVKSKEFENTLKPVVMQCHDILRHIASFQLPPVYPWMLELTDTGPEVGVSSAECRWHLLEKARIHNSDKVLRIHQAKRGFGPKRSGKAQCLHRRRSMWWRKPQVADLQAASWFVCGWD